MLDKCFDLTSPVKKYSVDNAKATIDQTTDVERSILHSQRQFSTPVQAQFGAEIELGSALLEQHLPRGTILHQGKGWHLETDNISTNNEGMRSDLEIIIEPESDSKHLEETMKDVVQFARKLLEGIEQTEDRTVDLKTILPDCKDVRVHCKQNILKSDIQTTFGVSLQKFKNLLDAVYHEESGVAGRPEIKILGEWVSKCCEFLADKFSDDLSQTNVPGFLYVVLSQLLRTQHVRVAEGKTIHCAFQVMLRSDTCSIFHKLLNPSECKLIKILILENENKRVPLLDCLGLEQSVLVFGHPYETASGEEKNNGPLARDWLKSIVYGRDDQPHNLHKDLLSPPPPGYPAHNPKNSKNYGMGAMGVDEKNGGRI